MEALLIEHTGSRITLMDLPEPFHQVMNPDALKELPERELLLAALLSTNWNKTRVAQKLNWSRMTVYRKMLKYNLPPTQPIKHT